MEHNSRPPNSSHPASSFFYNLSLMLTGGLVITGLLIGSGLLRGGASLLGGLQRTLTPQNPVQTSEPKVDVQSIVVQQIQGMSELTTAKFTMQAVVPTSRDRTFAGYRVGSTTLLYIAYGEVRAGIDLSQITRDNVQLTDNNGLTVQLPPPKILDSKIDVNRSQVYDYDRGFLGLGPDSAPELQQLAQQQTLQQVVSAACNEGILQEANTRAELAIRQLLTTTGHDTVTVLAQAPPPGSCVAAPSSAAAPTAPVAPAVSPAAAPPVAPATSPAAAPSAASTTQPPGNSTAPSPLNSQPLSPEPLPASPLPQAAPNPPLG